MRNSDDICHVILGTVRELVDLFFEEAPNYLTYTTIFTLYNSGVTGKYKDWMSKVGKQPN